MKKFFTLFVAAVLAVMTVNAKDYKHSVGMVGGLGIGAQYKTMVMDNFTIIAEMGYFTCMSNSSYAGGLANGVFAYQGHITEGQGIKLDFFAGGQVKAGFIMGNGGLIGTGAAGGIELNMTNAPIAISFDFRPGYGCMLTQNMVYDPAIDAMVINGVAVGHMFDYSFNLGVRYTF